MFLSDLDAIQSIGMDGSMGPSTLGTAHSQQVLSHIDVCPTCHLPFDKGKKRRLIDSCGHERCWSCLFSSKEECPLCNRSEFLSPFMKSFTIASVICVLTFFTLLAGTWFGQEVRNSSLIIHSFYLHLWRISHCVCFMGLHFFLFSLLTGTSFEQKIKKFVHVKF